MTSKIWYEMVDAKYGEIYLTRYLGVQRTLKKAFKIITLILSVSGVFGWKYFDAYAKIVFAVIAIMQLLTLIENEVIRSDKEVEEISALRMMYTRYFLKLDKLWTENYSGNISDKKAMEKYFKLRETDWEKIEELDCKLDVKQWKRLEAKAEKETHEYINKYHSYE